jgi:hypothetical protein
MRWTYLIFLSDPPMANRTIENSACPKRGAAVLGWLVLLGLGALASPSQGQESVLAPSPRKPAATRPSANPPRIAQGSKSVLPKPNPTRPPAARPRNGTLAPPANGQGPEPQDTGEQVPPGPGEVHEFADPFEDGDELAGPFPGRHGSASCGLQACGIGCCGVSGLWVRTEALLWWIQGFSVPPLVTSSPAGTNRDVAGVLGQPTTTILLGDSRLADDLRLGGRVRFGFWIDPCRTHGWEASYISLGTGDTDFRADSSGGVTPVDALVTVNYINAHPDSLALPQVQVAPPPYYDVSGDGFCTSRDVLLVINEGNLMRVPGAPFLDLDPDNSSDTDVFYDVNGDNLCTALTERRCQTSSPVS